MIKTSILRGKLRRYLLVVIDISIFCVINAIYYFFPHIFHIPATYSKDDFMLHSVILLLTVFASRLAFMLYIRVWRYTCTASYFKMVFADAVAVFVALPITYLITGHIAIWHYSFVASICLVATLLSRFTYRLLYKHRSAFSGTSYPQIPVAIVGAGQTGVYVAQELMHNPRSTYKPVMFIDKDDSKVGKKLSGIRIYGNGKSLADILAKHAVRDVVIAINGIDDDQATQLFEHYSTLGCNVKIFEVPVKDINKNTGNKLTKGTIRDFKIEDLLFRKQINVKDAQTVAFYSGKTVLVTGGGGSIGSEICRQLAMCDIKKLIIVDIYENNAYDIQQELIRDHGASLDLTVEIASVRDRDRLEDIFSTYRPDVVFHAAAHKHVPLMEHSAAEAIKNNVLGTYNTADMAEKYGVYKFILISTDKAVNPTNIMGASKRVCEMIVQSRGDSKTAFSAVRFGNVLGSNGSVIPLFRRQIAEGGPVTVTDKRIIRYFMTIPEASQLVMQAGAMAKRGELFVLDMGKPVRIIDLAINMIKMSGYIPNVDIKIEEIGLRPGEKLYEELLMKTETLSETENHMIFIEKDTPFSREEIAQKLEILCNAVEQSDVENAHAVVKDAIKRVVPTFREPDEVNRTADRANEMLQTVND